MKVFISSTFAELKDYREAVRNQLDKLEIQGTRMETFGSDEKTPLNVSLKKLEECDIYIGIIGHTYGSTPPGEDRSYTQCEYERAYELMQEGRMRLLLYLADEGIDLPASILKKAGAPSLVKQDEFRKRLQGNHTTAFFNSPVELAQQVVSDFFKLHKENKLPTDGKEEVQLFDVGEEEMIRSNFDSAARESLNKIEGFINFIAKSFGRLFKLDAVSLNVHPFFREVNTQLESIIPGISLNDKGGILERADVRHVILRAGTIISLITRINEDERHSVGREIGNGAAADLIENIVNKGKLVPRSADAFISLWNFWDRTGGWGTLELIKSPDKDDERLPEKTPDKPEWWYIKITNNFLRSDSGEDEEMQRRNKFWCGYIHGFLDTALPRITERMSGLNDARRPEVTFPEYYRVASVEPCYIEGDSEADVFRVVFQEEMFSVALQALSESQKRLKKEDYRASMVESRNALASARATLNEVEFLNRVKKMTPSYEPVIDEILRTISPPAQMVSKEKATQWFTVANDVVQQITKG
ncbi:MAG: hypothetical protein QOH51_135 [Acidobacteriota bacterium]|jgi:hypothetical protein|nr:hypothetical protein [Acidobacteriota bacterium]